MRSSMVIWLLAPLLALAGAGPSVAQSSPQSPPYDIQTVAKDLELPWSLAFLTNGDLLVTELPGRLQLIKPDGTRQTVVGLPQDIYAPDSFNNQGGLMDVVLHPDFARNELLYLTYAKGERRSNNLAVMRARYRDGRLSEQKDIFVAQHQRKTTPVHYGGRMVFLADGTFLLTVGDGFDYREQAQMLTNHFGTIVHLTDEGAPAAGNPYEGQADALPSIWTHGHRNAQSIAVDDQGRVYATEHGPRGGDELNLIEPKKNYGWPVITYGVDYSGARISPWTQYPGMEQPLVDWTPSVAPSGMTWYNGALFPAWRGDILVTTLVDKNVIRVDMDDGRVRGQEVLFADIDERMRDIRTAPDGSLYLLVEGKSDDESKAKGRVLRILPRR